MHDALQAHRDEVRYKEFPGVGDAWPMVYATTDLWPWMLAHRLGDAMHHSCAGDALYPVNYLAYAPGQPGCPAPP